jgi:integrase
MEPSLTQIDPIPGDDALEENIKRRLLDLNSGRYEQNNASVLRKFAIWARNEYGITTVSEIDKSVCRNYARALSRVEDSGNITPETARRYYSYLRSFLSWAVAEQLLSRNPAMANEATQPLPKDETDTDTQYWSERERSAICTTATKRVDTAGESDTLDREIAYRDRAIVYTLSFSGARGAELFSVASDADRDGIRWNDVSLNDGTMTVFGKNRTTETAPILSEAIPQIRQWHDLQSPSENDPMFPRLDNAAKGIDPTPAISTQTARIILKELCEWSDYEFDEPLTPHGARRGLGRQLYREDPAVAQDVLRHSSIKTTHESYAEESAKQTRERANNILSPD